MEHHVRVLGWAYILYGFASSALCLVILLTFGSLPDAWAWARAAGGLGPVFFGLLLFHLVAGIPMTVAGVFLLQLHEWSRLMVIVLSAVNLLNVPFGSALGTYGLWVLLSPETEPLFTDPVLRSRIGARMWTGRARREAPLKRKPAQSETIAPSIRDATTNLPE